MGTPTLQSLFRKINALYLFTKTAVVNSFGEVGLERTSSGLFDLGGSQQPFRYNPRKQRDFSAERLDGEGVG
jgi:hypothetical protein